MKTIHLATSDLAKLTGHNTYEPLQNTIDKILVRNNLSKKYIPKSNLEQQLLELPSDEILKMKIQIIHSPEPNKEIAMAIAKG